MGYRQVKHVLPTAIRRLPPRLLDKDDNFKCRNLTKLPDNIPKVLHYNNGDGPTWFFPSDMLAIQTGATSWEFYKGGFIYKYNSRTRKVRVCKNN